MERPGTSNRRKQRAASMVCNHNGFNMVAINPTGDSMPSITLKNMSDELHQRLKDRAKRHRRSLNKEVIHCLEAALESRPLDPESYLERIRPIRDRTARIHLDDEWLRSAKNEGRP